MSWTPPWFKWRPRVFDWRYDNPPPPAPGSWAAGSTPVRGPLMTAGAGLLVLGGGISLLFLGFPVLGFLVDIFGALVFSAGVLSLRRRRGG